VAEFAGMMSGHGPETTRWDRRRETFDALIAHIRAAADWLEELPPDDARNRLQQTLCYALDCVESMMKAVPVNDGGDPDPECGDGTALKAAVTHIEARDA
jgi:hypothetical protein